jgi:hypothetical protein
VYEQLVKEIEGILERYRGRFVDLDLDPQFLQLFPLQLSYLFPYPLTSCGYSL